MDCPVCGAKAQDPTATTFDGTTILCPNCGAYDISGSVYDTRALDRLGPNERRAALDRAKRSARSGKRPMITSDCL